ncbi:hypothetical protein QWZ08_08070 [Ferruginibacter paludis]|uniref:hypothetical protein n=1 Tax=Ferruginibacter paludis TaxID=1310417 RepID=UPI0025B41CC9|nr:hypothetical protein [Ferruginibacter paludis]MDN3655578.1 hypothetical protein [Ferruginibacter paludis]
MKRSILLYLVLLNYTIQAVAQTNSFDVFTYQTPEVFIKSELPSRVQFNMTSTSINFCTITLYKSLPAKRDAMTGIISQWNEQVVKRLNKANKKPARIMTEQVWDGWVSTLAIGNFYQNKKKCVVMLNSFRKDSITTCAVFEMSDPIFKNPVQQFSRNIHFKKQQ